MSAIVDRNGRVRQLDRRTEPDEVIPPEDAVDGLKLSKLLIRILRELATLRRRWWPQRTDFEDVVLDATGTKTFRLTHGFTGRVRWYVVDWTGAAAPAPRRDPSSDLNTLVLTSTSAGTATIRVEEAG